MHQRTASSQVMAASGIERNHMLDQSPCFSGNNCVRRHVLGHNDLALPSISRIRPQQPPSMLSSTSATTLSRHRLACFPVRHSRQVVSGARETSPQIGTSSTTLRPGRCSSEQLRYRLLLRQVQITRIRTARISSAQNALAPLTCIECPPSACREDCPWPAYEPAPSNIGTEQRRNAFCSSRRRVRSRDGRYRCGRRVFDAGLLYPCYQKPVEARPGRN